MPPCRRGLAGVNAPLTLLSEALRLGTTFGMGEVAVLPYLATRWNVGLIRNELFRLGGGYGGSGWNLLSWGRFFRLVG